MDKEPLQFNDVKFKIKEFESVDIMQGCFLALYEPKERHMQTEQSEDEDIIIKKRGSKKETCLVDAGNNNQPIKKIYIDKTESQEHLKEINKEKEEKISKLGLNADNIDSVFGEIKEEDYQKRKEERRKRIEESKNKRLQKTLKEERAEKFKDYDIFYDVYTNEKNINSYIKKFEVTNGIAAVEADFFQKCFGRKDQNFEGKHWCIIPRLISKDTSKMNKFEFDPVPIINSSFVITDLHNIKEKTLTFQRRIAEIENPNLVLQSPQEFKDMLDGNPKNKYDKMEQAKKIQESAKYIKKAIDSYDDKEVSQETKKIMKDKQDENIKTCQEVLDKEKERVPPKIIGDTGEYVTSLLFSKKSTRHLSNQRKMDANFNLDGFNHTIPDFLVTLNGYPTLVEVKNVQEQSLTEQISFELKLAREYELDYLFVCNDYTELLENIAGGVLSIEEHEALVKDKEAVEKFDEDTKREKRKERANILKADKESRNWSELQKLKTSRLRAFSEVGGDSDARSGFIDHRHLHRSIKTIFKEIYIHHIKGATPNKIMIKRMDLNDAAKMEKEFNENQSLQKCGN